MSAMNKMEREKGEAKLRFLDGDFEVLQPGAYVVCAVTGTHIPLDALRYWSVDLQEAYASPAIATKRMQEKGTGPDDAAARLCRRRCWPLRRCRPALAPTRQPACQSRARWSRAASALGMPSRRRRHGRRSKQSAVSPDGVFAFGFGYRPDQTQLVTVRYPDGGGDSRNPIRPRVRQYEIQHVNGLPQNTVTPPPEVLARIKQEAETHLSRAPARHDGRRFPFRLRLAGAGHRERRVRQPAHRQWRADGAAFRRRYGGADRHADPCARRWHGLAVRPIIISMAASP